MTAASNEPRSAQDWERLRVDLSEYLMEAAKRLWTHAGPIQAIAIEDHKSGFVLRLERIRELHEAMGNGA